MFGIWSQGSGGFIATEFRTQETAEAEILELVKGNPDLAEDTLEVLEMCQEPGHDEQPADDCEMCAEEG